MKTKQKLTSLALALILILAFTACGAASQESKTSSAEMKSNDSAAQAPAADQSSLYSTADANGETRSAASGTDVENGSEMSETTTGLPSADKIVYSGYAEIETLEFDKTIDDLMKMVSDCGAFVQYSNVTGGDYNSMYSGNGASRYANYTIRIPKDKFKSVEDSLETLGNVINSSTNAENITMQYTDTESRLAACRTKESRLLELLSKATSMEDILAIENSLSDVRYEIESLTSEIKNWDSLISYSTLSLTISEVALYSEDNSSTIGYGQQLRETFVHSIKTIGHFFKGFFKFLVGAFPVLVILAIIAVPVLFIVRVIRKKKEAKKQDSMGKNNDNSAQL